MTEVFKVLKKDFRKAITIIEELEGDFPRGQ